jgi:hypothetical protein
MNKLTIILNAGQMPLGVSSCGMTIFSSDVTGRLALPAYEK